MSAKQEYLELVCFTAGFTPSFNLLVKPALVLPLVILPFVTNRNKLTLGLIHDVSLVM